MKTPTAPGTGRQGFQVISDCSNQPDTAALPLRQQFTLSPVGRDGQKLVAVLAELFPKTFVADWVAPHKPLKVGIADELVALGLLRADEARQALRCYAGRLMYQRALSAGGPRYSLDGEPCGEVTVEQMAAGKARVAAIEARRALKAKAFAAEKQAARQVAKAPKAMQPAIPAQSVKPASLADLKAAARKKSAQ